MSRTPVLVAAAAVAALALTSCSGGGLGVFGGEEAAGAAGSGGPVATLTPRPGVALSANSTAALGTVVIDVRGFTLYRSDRDTANPPTSTCEGACAETWQPVIYAEPIELEGIDQADIGRLTRSDGKEQVTVGGFPVYTYAADPQPGAVEGHGQDGSWFAVTPEGEKAEAP